MEQDRACFCRSLPATWYTLTSQASNEALHQSSSISTSNYLHECRYGYKKMQKKFSKDLMRNNIAKTVSPRILWIYKELQLQSGYTLTPLLWRPSLPSVGIVERRHQYFKLVSLFCLLLWDLLECASLGCVLGTVGKLSVVFLVLSENSRQGGVHELGFVAFWHTSWKLLNFKVFMNEKMKKWLLYWLWPWQRHGAH
jgi:hypothetical protein